MWTVTLLAIAVAQTPESPIEAVPQPDSITETQTETEHETEQTVDKPRVEQTRSNPRRTKGSRATKHRHRIVNLSRMTTC